VRVRPVVPSRWRFGTLRMGRRIAGEERRFHGRTGLGRASVSRIGVACSMTPADK
jgi:hypothetical protein